MRMVTASKATRVAFGAGVILLLLTNSGCGPPPAVKEFLENVKKTKQNYKASDVKRAALPLIGGTNADVPVPKLISSLPIFQPQNHPDFDVSPLGGANPKEQDGIFLTIGSGFGHWGLAVCTSKKSVEEAQKSKGTLYPWADGVYFWIEK